MDAQSHVEILRLYCEHLRTLLDQVITELMTFKHELAMNGNHSFSTVAPYLNGLEKQSEHIAAETRHLQSFLHSLRPQSMDAAEEAGESPQASPPTSDTPEP